MKNKILAFVVAMYLFGFHGAFAQSVPAPTVSWKVTTTATAITAGQDITVDISLLNPSQYAVTSAEIALSFDPALFTGKTVTYPTTPYFALELFASEENKFRDTGIVRLGRASLTAGNATAPAEIPFATLVLTPKVTTSSAKFMFVDMIDGLPSLSAKILQNGSYVQVLQPTSGEALSFPMTSLPVRSEVIPSSPTTTSTSPSTTSTSGSVTLLPVGSSTSSDAGLATIPVREEYTEEVRSVVTASTETAAIGGGEDSPAVTEEAKKALKKAPSTPKSGPMEDMLLIFFLSITGAYFYSLRHNSLRI